MKFSPLITLSLAGAPLLLMMGQEHARALDEPQTQLQIQETNGKIQATIVHRLDVEPRATLLMKGLRGNAMVLGTDVDRIVIEERIRVKTRERGTGREVIEQVRGSLYVADSAEGIYAFKVGGWPSREVAYDYKVRLPRVFNTIVHTYGGDLDLSNLQGDLEIKTGGGEVAVSAAAGKVAVYSGGGDISLFKVQGQIEVKTGGGEISGRKLEGRLTAVTGGGDIEIYASIGDFRLETGGGDIELEQLEGSEILARTGAGDIDLTSVAGNVNLMTGGGEITAADVDGDVEAASSGGDLNFRRIRGDAVLFTSGGDIELNRVTGAVRLKTNAGNVDVREMLLLDPGRDTSTISTLSGEVLVRLQTDKEVGIEALVRGLSPRYGADRIESDLDLEYIGNQGGTLARYQAALPGHYLMIETTEGEIRIFKEED